VSDIEVRVPDIGDFKEIPVIEVLVKPGDRINKEDPLITLESEKAAMEVPSPNAGVVKSLKLKIGDKVSQGTAILTLEAQDAPQQAQQPPQPQQQQPPKPAEQLSEPNAPAPSAPQKQPNADRNPAHNVDEGGEVMEAPDALGPSGTMAPELSKSPPSAETSMHEGRTEQPEPSENGSVHASPSIRRYARELGVELHGLHGSGPNGRITREDVQAHVKSALASGTAAGASVPGLAPWPKIDFAQFGEVERRPLSRIKKISGPNLHRNWVMIPHVTNHDDADITDLEAFRQSINAENQKAGVKVTLLAFLIKAVVAALQKYPEFNSSLDGDALAIKKYYAIGFAADTPNGLIVPVIKDADKKGVLDIARETSELAQKARDGKLGPAQMTGGTFTISSLGGIGGTYFTPIINAPEVAILGVCRAAMRPIWNGSAFEPRLMLPLSLSYDHRVIDGAAAARFNVYLAGLLADMRRAML